MKRRTLTPDEQAMWESIVRTDRPLSSKKIASPLPGARITVRREQGDWAPALPQRWEHLPLGVGAYAGIDRSTAERFRKGDYPIDAALDLHGMSREKAHLALTRFLRAQYERASRCLLVITGKGQKREDEPEDSFLPGQMRGVLKDALPGWLAEPGLRAMVLAFDTARLKHGGSGAYYILLRRKR